MKIVRIIARLNIGGPARNAMLLTEALSCRSGLNLTYKNCGYETVLVCGETGEAEGDMMYLAQQKGIRPIIVKELAREISWKDDWTAFWKIYKIIRREKPDIIHTHTAKAGTLGRFAGILYSKAILIHTFHGHVFSGYFGKIKTLFFIWIERFLGLFTDKIITVSENLKKELAEIFKIAPEDKISVIELGFELEELLKLPVVGEGLKPSPTINIGIIGRLVPIKNHKMLFKSVCRGGFQTRPYKIIVIGDGELRGELEKYAEELGIRDRIEFKGWIKDLKAIYEELDIVALTSLNEGTPVSLIEAMAGARPVVATNVGGVKDIVKDGVSGYLVESGNVEEFTKRLLELIKDPEKRRAFGLNGRDIVKNRFSKERLIKDTEKLYNNLLDKRRHIK
ncbi:MAG: glycosyltransferase family 4 protein [Candidatus Omnitrophota bacterium]|nr:glycosyltransferase family 4 protein [Candidatus Omnitrophota bacterium]